METPTIKELVEATGMTQTEFAAHFGIPLRSVQNWIAGKRNCPEYVRNMIEKILENEKKANKKKTIINTDQTNQIETALNILDAVWEDLKNGKIDRNILQNAVNCQTQINRIVWKLNDVCFCNPTMTKHKSKKKV